MNGEFLLFNANKLFMKPIELTEEHKSKLLEMCKVLFPEPEYSFWWEYEMYGRGLKQAFNDVLCVRHNFKKPIIEVYNGKEFKRSNNYFNIHWFEFCIKHLIPKLSNEIQSTIDIRMLFCELPNPVDYLYQKFKKIKL